MQTKLKVKNDFIFNRIFGRNENKEILLSLLNAILGTEEAERLTDIEILENTKLDKNRIEDKQGILDIRAKTLTGTQINIEIQLVNQYNMDKRTLFYWSKLYTNQLNEGQQFGELKKTITINIIDFNYIGLENYHTVFHLWEDAIKSYKLSDVLEVHFVELPKFKKFVPDLKKPLDRWLLFIDGTSEEVLEMAMKEEPTIEKAEKVLKYLGTNEEIVRNYELRQKAIHDDITRITGAREEGIQKGMQQGIQQGAQNEKIETAKNMLVEGIDIKIIEKVTGLSNDIIEMLKREM